VLGGGGYNPWSVGRLWTGVWGVLSRQELPDRLGGAASAILRDLTWVRQRGPVPAYLTTTLQDAARPGPVRPEVGELAEAAAKRARHWAWSGENGAG